MRVRDNFALVPHCNGCCATGMATTAVTCCTQTRTSPHTYAEPRLLVQRMPKHAVSRACKHTVYQGGTGPSCGAGPSILCRHCWPNYDGQKLVNGVPLVLGGFEAEDPVGGGSQLAQALACQSLGLTLVSLGACNGM
jgi:hypothetical protein